MLDNYSSGSSLAHLDACVGQLLFSGDGHRQAVWIGAAALASVAVVVAHAWQEAHAVHAVATPHLLGAAAVAHCALVMSKKLLIVVPQAYQIS